MTNSASGLPDPRLTGEDTSGEIAGAIGRRTPLGRNDEAVTSLPNGRVIESLRSRRVKGGGVSCAAFYRQTIKDGKRILAIGQVTAGSGSKELEVELSDVGSEPEGKKVVWIEVTGDGVEEDGLLFPGFNLTAATDGSGTTLPSNTLPTPSSPDSKKCYVLLGQWSDGIFTASACGNIQISFCPGGYTVTRF